MSKWGMKMNLLLKFAQQFKQFGLGGGSESVDPDPITYKLGRHGLMFVYYSNKEI
jgi:hypothetical protein